jgi:dephospho-CoA kinase
MSQLGSTRRFTLSFVFTVVFAESCHPLEVAALTAPVRPRKPCFRLFMAAVTDDGPAGMSATPPLSSSTSLSSVKVLGVCGGIGSGKSKACELLVAELGCLAHVDSDSLAHTVYQPGSLAIQDVIAEFGDDLLNASDGTIDRKKLGSIVFSDPSAMARLERIVWPHVRAKVEERIKALKRDEVGRTTASCKYPVIVVEGAVLLDAGWENMVDGVWVVTVPRPVAQTRLQQNRGLSMEETDRRIDSQQSRRGIGNLAVEVSNHVVTAVIDNSATIEELTSLLQSKLEDPSSWYSS